MTTTYYASGSNGDVISLDVENSGTVSTAGDVFEFRMGNGTYVPTQRQALNFLERLERWIIQNGSDGDGENLPPDRG
ncbi:MAG: hypothetical protein ACRDRB_20800 [Pseudonocardiaceae bacterium]